MNPNLILYIICFVPCLLIVGLYSFLHVKVSGEKRFKILSTFVKITAFVAGFLTFIGIFHESGVMETTSGLTQGSYDPNVGCVNLVGVPYGENRIANLFALLSIFLFFPSGVICFLLPFFDFRIGRLFNKWIGLPLIAVVAVTLFNFLNAMHGNNSLDYENIILSLMVGMSLANAIVDRIYFNDTTKGFSFKEILLCLGYFVFACLVCMPAYVPAAIIPTNWVLFGAAEYSHQIYDLELMHRVFIYYAALYPFLLFIIFGGASKECKTSVLLTLSFGALFSFFGDYGAKDIFSPLATGGYSVNVNSLPIHLCHTALFVVPLCVCFKWNKLFYFTYFINVFGAIMAMLMPNSGEGSNIFDPNVMLFWYNHVVAYGAPLLAVAFGIFERPKMKQMLWSLFFFALYFVAILFGNAYLSNFVNGYDPNVIGSGTDYLFINDTFILDNLWVGADKLISFSLSFNIGEKILVFHPIYQSIFFLLYVLIAFGMWFVYSLFFQIADSHKDLHEHLYRKRAAKLLNKTGGKR